VVPDQIRDQIKQELNLSDEAEDTLYRDLGGALAYGHETTCFRLAAPSPTYVYKLDFSDDGADYWLTFWLTYGPRDDALYVMQWDVEDAHKNDPYDPDIPDALKCARA
jgi:hypothetical protein